MLETIKKILLVKSIIDSVPFIISTGYLVCDITFTLVKWTTKDLSIDKCKCFVCEDYRKKYGREPEKH